MIDAIIKRVSTRTYLKEKLSEKDHNMIDMLVHEHHTLKGPFGNFIEFLFTLNDSNNENGQKIGTYGLIKNVPAFVGGACEDKLESIVDFGFCFENLILSLTKIGYDTCWLGGTFKRSDYRRLLLKNEIIPAISPVGHRANKRSFAERAIRTSTKPLNRLDNSLLFKNYEDELLFDMSEESIMSQCLDLVRIGPSASNKQPWRLYIDGNNIHFYLERTNNYPSKSIGYDIQALDIGIALNHFSHGLNNFDQKFIYTKLENMKKFVDQVYIISIQIS